MFKQERSTAVIPGRVFAQSILTCVDSGIRVGSILSHQVALGMDFRPEDDEMARFDLAIRATPVGTAAYTHNHLGQECTRADHQISFDGPHKFIRGSRRSRFHWEMRIVDGSVAVVARHREGAAEVLTSFHDGAEPMGRPMHNTFTVTA